MEVQVGKNEDGEIDEGSSVPNDSNNLVLNKRGMPIRGKQVRDNLPAANGQLNLPKTMPDPGAEGRWTNQMEYIKTSVLGAASKNKLLGFQLLKDPVNPWKENIPDYYNYIKEPMDVSSIRRRLKNRYYQSADDCLKDIRLMFCNCYIYNRPDTPVVKLARDFELFVIRKLIDMPEVEEDYVQGPAVGRQDNSINTEHHNEREIQPFDLTAPVTISFSSVSGSGRLSPSLSAVTGRGGKVLRPPEEEANTSDSDESYKASSTEVEDSDNDEEVTEEEEDSSTEVSNVLNKMEERKKKRIELLVQKLADTEEHIKRYLQAEKNDARKLKRLRGLKKDTTANLQKRARQSYCSSSDARNKDCNNSPTGKKPDTKDVKVSTSSKANHPSASNPTSAQHNAEDKVGNGEPEKPSRIAVAPVVNGDTQSADVENASESEDDGHLDTY